MAFALHEVLYLNTHELWYVSELLATLLTIPGQQRAEKCEMLPRLWTLTSRVTTLCQIFQHCSTIEFFKVLDATVVLQFQSFSHGPPLVFGWLQEHFQIENDRYDESCVQMAMSSIPWRA